MAVTLELKALSRANGDLCGCFTFWEVGSIHCCSWGKGGSYLLKSSFSFSFSGESRESFSCFANFEKMDNLATFVSFTFSYFIIFWPPFQIILLIGYVFYCNLRRMFSLCLANAAFHWMEIDTWVLLGGPNPTHYQMNFLLGPGPGPGPRPFWLAYLFFSQLQNNTQNQIIHL